MTEFHPTTRQPMNPGTLPYIQQTSDQAALGEYHQQMLRRAHDQAGGFVTPPGSVTGRPEPEPVARQLTPRERRR